MNEQWKDVPGFEGFYMASTTGRVKSLERVVIRKDGKTNRYNEKIMKPALNHHGYHRLHLRRDNQRSQLFVHTIIARTFIGQPEGELQVNHKNAIKTDNRIENLEWVTCVENIHHAIKLKIRRPQGYRNLKDSVRFLGA